MDRDKLKKYCDTGYSTYKISESENVSQSTTIYWLKKFGLKTSVYKYWDMVVLREAVSLSLSINEALRRLKKNDSSSSYTSFRRNVKKHNIDISHFLTVGELNSRHGYRRIPNDDMFIENSTIKRDSVKKRIVNDKLIEYKCFKCGNPGIWNDNKLVLILDHINGKRFDNRLFNLRFVCPNCNSQLPTHCRKTVG